jgi:hypothetical protein
MTYSEKQAELQKLFSERFDAYQKLKAENSPGKEESVEFLKAKSEFEKVNTEYQEFLILFKENTSAPNDEYGTKGDHCA